MLCAFAMGPLLSAWLNRDGPGQFCLPYPDAASCGTRLNPWPRPGGAATSLAIAMGLFLHASCHDAIAKILDC